MFRFRVWPRLTRGRTVFVGGLVGLIALSWSEGVAVIAPLVALAGVVVGHAAWELAAARGAMETALRLTEAGEESSAPAAIAPESTMPGSVMGTDGVLGLEVALAVADPGGGPIP